MGVAPLVGPGTDCEDELLAPADVPAVGNQEMDSELQSVFIDVVSLPTMITPVSDVDRALCAPEYVDAVIAPPAISPVVIRPPTATTSAEPRSPASATTVGISSERSTPPVAAVPEDLLLFNAAMTSQTQPETSLFPQVHAPGPDVGLVSSGGTPDITDRPREGPFDAHHDRQCSTTSPQLLQEIQGCLFCMTSYDVESDGPNFSPEHGVQLTNPQFLEYVGAPESARLMSRSPEYWVHHMGRENVLSAALQLQHDAGLEEMQQAAKLQYWKKQPAQCDLCSTTIRCDMYRHVARCHLDLAQLWRCPVAWCTVWQGAQQDLMDHVRYAHRVPEEVQSVKLEKLIPLWTVTRLWAVILDRPDVRSLADAYPGSGRHPHESHLA